MFTCPGSASGTLKGAILVQTENKSRGGGAVFGCAPDCVPEDRSLPALCPQAGVPLGRGCLLSSVSTRHSHLSLETCQ